MKFLSPFALVLVLAQAAVAQFGVRERGTSGNELLTDASLMTGDSRMVITGHTDRLSPRDIMLIATNDPATSAGTTIFENVYSLVNPVTGIRYRAWPIAVRQLSNGNIFMVGNYIDPLGTAVGVFTARFTSAGVPINPVATFQTTGASSVHINAQAMTLSEPLSNNVFITGHVDMTPYGLPGRQGVFGMRVDGGTNTLTWSKLYDIPSFTTGQLAAYDIIQLSTGGNVAMVGYGAGRIFLLTANPTTGLLVAGQSFSYDLGPNSTETVFSIDRTATSGNFVLAGTTDGAGSATLLAFRITLPGGAVGSSTVVSYSIGSSLRPNDVRSRTNSGGAQEFYIAATASPGVHGSQDMVVFKRNATLGSIGEYSYGTTSEEVGLRVIPNAASGMVVLGTITPGALGGSDVYVTKAYRNGTQQLQCGYLSGIPTSTAPVVTRTTLSPVIRDPLIAAPPLNIALVGSVTSFATCVEVPSIPGGSNAMVLSGDNGIANELADAAKSAGTQDALLFPNPVPAGRSPLNVRVNSPIDQLVAVSITEVTGRLVMRSTLSVGSGASVQAIDLPQLPAGLYILDILGEGLDENKLRFAVE